MNIDIGERVMYYPSSQRTGKTQDDLFHEPTWLGTVKSVDYEKREYFIKGDGIVTLSESVPENYVRPVRVLKWYQFYRQKGFRNYSINI